ncbi:MAG TPA: UPF0175 family protein [Dehalococcoidia bacterium]|nr:UPF0175 family protein [Dehalococcoidia bacterium]
MAKTVSVAELGHGGASRAIRAAQQEPVLVSKENRPAAWILSAERLAQVAAARGAEPAEFYERALDLLAIELYRTQVLTLGQAAKLAGQSLADFIDLCGRLQIPVLWEPKGGIAAEVDALEATLREAEAAE